MFPFLLQFFKLSIHILPERKKLLCGVDVTVAEELVVLNIFVQLSYLLPQQRGQWQVLILSQQVVAGAYLQQFCEDSKGQLQTIHLASLPHGILDTQ